MPMSNKFLISIFAFSLLANPAFAETKQSPLDRAIDVGQKAFDTGNFLKAERTWAKAQSDLSKANQQDEKLAHLLQQLGDCYTKEGKFAKASESYNQAVEILKGLSLDQTDALAKLKELSIIFRPINLEGFDENATAFAKQVGAVCASAMNKDDKRHIDISLKQRFQEGIKELIESAPSNVVGAGGAQAAADAAKAMTPANTPAVKQIRLDKIIAFDVVRGDGTSNLKLANIQGIFLNVGLWVKLKEFVMLMNEQNTPVAEVTAGAFGVDKKVRVDLPANLFTRLKEGIDKFDPFISSLPAASTAITAPAATTAPADSANSKSVGSDAVKASSENTSTTQGTTEQNSADKKPASTSSGSESSSVTDSPALPASSSSAN